MVAPSGPKYHPGQVLRNLHSWAAQIPPRPVTDVQWDESWKCYTYHFPCSLIRIEEHMLAPLGDPDISAEDWLQQHIELLEQRRAAEAKTREAARG